MNKAQMRQDGKQMIADEKMRELDKGFCDYLTQPDVIKRMRGDCKDCTLEEIQDWLAIEHTGWLADRIDDATNSGPGFRGELV